MLQNSKKRFTQLISIRLWRYRVLCAVGYSML